MVSIGIELELVSEKFTGFGNVLIGMKVEMYRTIIDSCNKTNTKEESE